MKARLAITPEVINEFLLLHPNFFKRSKERCWSWRRKTFNGGYGTIRLQGKTFVAHRVAFAVVYGDPGRLDVHHECRNKNCFNPYHGKAMDRPTHQRLHPANKKKMSDRNRRRWSTPGSREWRSDLSRKLWQDPEYQKKMKNRNKGRTRNEKGQYT